MRTLKEVAKIKAEKQAQAVKARQSLDKKIDSRLSNKNDVSLFNLQCTLHSFANKDNDIERISLILKNLHLPCETIITLTEIIKSQSPFFNANCEHKPCLNIASLKIM